jgi:hypothetical protein
LKKTFVRRWLDKLEVTAAAAAFAEEGEAETARQLLEESGEESGGSAPARQAPRTPAHGAPSRKRSRA